MSIDDFDENCPGCRPAAVDMQTGKVLPPDDPVMQKILAVWASRSLEEKRLFHRVTCQNCHDPEDIRKMKVLMESIQKEIQRKELQ